MTTLRIARTELERLFSSGLSRLAVLAVLLVPALYAGFHLYAQDDPYESLSRVPAAIVVHDQGVEQPDGTPLNAGFDVADELAAGDAFDWELVTEADAEDGIEDGSYEFALVIPDGFSASLVGPASSDGETAPTRVTVRTDDAGSYLSQSITDRITESVRDALAAQVGPEAADTFLVGFAEIRDDLARAGKDAAALRDDIGAAGRDAGRLERGAGRVVDSARDLDDDSDRITSRANSIAGLSSGTVRDYQRVRSTLISRMNRMRLTAVERQFLLGAYGFLGQRLTVTNRAIQNATNGLRGLGGDTSEVTADARGLARDARELRGTLDELRAGGAELERGLDNTAGQLPEEEETGTATRDGLADALGDPVQLENTAASEADSYGEGLAPFLLAAAAWIGGYALMLLVRPLSTRAVTANQKPFRVALGGWLAPAWLGVLQAALLGGAVVLVVGTGPEEAGWTIGFLLLASLAFLAILHALVSWFGVVGQFLGLAFLVLQLVAAGGSFPWQTIPEPLHWLHHAMPLPHAVDGLRRLMFGGAPELAAYDAAVLVAWLVVGLTFSALAARRLRTWSVRRINPVVAV